MAGGIQRKVKEFMRVDYALGYVTDDASLQVGVFQYPRQSPLEQTAGGICLNLTSASLS
jgi:hypothetical protein